MRIHRPENSANTTDLNRCGCGGPADDWCPVCHDVFCGDPCRSLHARTFDGECRSRADAEINPRIVPDESLNADNQIAWLP